MEQAYKIATMQTGSAQLTYKQDCPYSVEYPKGACQYNLLSIHWTGPIQSLQVSKHNYHCYRKSLTA